MRRMLILLMIPVLCSFAGCLSQSTKDNLVEMGKDVGQKVAQGMKEEGVKIAAEAKTAAFDGAKAGTAAVIQGDKDLTPEKKQDLLAQLADAAGFAGIGGVLIAYAKAKSAAKLKKTVGILVSASQELPENALAALKGEVKKLGGDHPSIASIIAEAKST